MITPSELKREYEKRHHGLFFDRKTMQFFDKKTFERVYE